MNEHPARPRPYYASLTRNMVLIIVLVSVTPLILIPAIIFHYFEASYRQKNIDYLKVLVRKQADSINGYLNERLADIKFMVRTHPGASITDESFLNETLRSLREEYGRSYVDLGVVDGQGIQVAYAGPFRLKNANYSAAAWFQEALKRDEYISGVFQGLREHPHFVVAVRTEIDGMPRLVRATVNFDEFTSLVRNFRIGLTGFAFILGKNGDFVTTPNAPIPPSKEGYLSFLTSENSLQDGVKVMEGTDAEGKSVLRIMTGMKNGEWVLCYQQDTREAFSVLSDARRVAGVAFAVGFLAIVGVAVFVSRKMVRRVADADRQKELLNDQVIEAGKLASLGELAAAIAHEINNPVAIMVEEAGWMEDILGDEDLKRSHSFDEFSRSLSQIRIQGRRCKDITFKLLSFARKTDPALKEVSVNSLVEDVVALSQNRSKYAKVAVTTRLRDDLPPLTVSPTELQQILLNLINNSCDAMEAHGGAIEIATRREEDSVVVDVADNGPGIPPAILPQIFTPFFTTKPTGKGTGLGLSICYGIIKRLGGDVTVESTVGVGTTFHVYVPVPADKRSRAAKRVL
jgi:two-component system, NtrC family, sensor kinase